MCSLKFTFKGNAFYEGMVVVKSYHYLPVLGAFNHFIPLVTDKYGAPDKRESDQIPSRPNEQDQSASWRLIDIASSDVYNIETWTMGAGTEMPSGRVIYHFVLKYTAVSLGKRLKEDGI